MKFDTDTGFWPVSAGVDTEALVSTPAETRQIGGNPRRVHANRQIYKTVNMKRAKFKEKLAI